MNPNMSAPGQERIRPPMTPEEARYAELPTQAMPIGRTALLKNAVGRVDTIGEYDQDLGQNVLVSRQVRGLQPGGQPIYGAELRRTPVNASPLEEAPATEVVQAPKIGKPAEATPAPTPVARPEKPKYYNLTPPEKDEFAGLSTEEKMKLVDERAAKAGQADAPTVAYNVDSAVKAADAEPVTQKPEAQQPRTVRPRPQDEIEPEFEGDIPRAVTADDVQFGAPRLHRNKQYE